MGKRPYVVVVPCPAQGHVKPLLKLAYLIADYGIKVTLLNPTSVHAKITAASPEKEREESGVTLLSVPGILDLEADQVDVTTWLNSLQSQMKAYLKNMIQKIDESGSEENFSFVVADATVGWILEVPKEMGIKHAAVWPGGPGCMVLLRQIPKLIEAGIIDKDGMMLKNELVSVCEEIPAWRSTELSWSFPGDQPEEMQKISFQFFQTIKQAIELPSWLLCNTFHELHPGMSRFIPNMLPIGPLLDTNNPKHSNGSLLLEDDSCLSWLDERPPCSVIYVSFGSTTKLTQHQFDELALGLELAGRPFLWAVRSGFIYNQLSTQFPDGFRERVASFGKIVEWAPQEEVLAHPSVACFFTHCGWNSTMEGLSRGVPFLCWPYFADQFHNRDFICDRWKVGLKLNRDPEEVISRHEIKTKIERLLTDKAIRENALKWKEKAVNSYQGGGSSLTNLETFIQHLKG
ncbi:7-deoxyloganetin glucosyltransferase [Bertholletia excelsa]